jgi:tRNA modification GTPase
MSDTIVAPITAQGSGAVAVIRLSGPKAIEFCALFWKGKKLSQVPSHTAHLGKIYDHHRLIDEVLLTVFRSPHSYTGEDVVEISCHGSAFIVKEILGLFYKAGARQAQPGEFTQRAFLNGKMDLVQAEAVADIIASESAASHQAALMQMKGTLSQQLKTLREELINFASLVELELDFAEEDVEFANRDRLLQFLLNLKAQISELTDSFSMGTAIKNGIPTVIVGKPNAGKSTLLNALLGEEKAIVSEVEGTTRDFIEDQIDINGVKFRIVDTAGLRETDDLVESIGVERTKSKIKTASLVILLFDARHYDKALILSQTSDFQDIAMLLVANKSDLLDEVQLKSLEQEDIILISAAQKTGLEKLKAAIFSKMKLDTGQTLLSNARHYDALLKTQNAIQATLLALEQRQSGELLAFHLREALRYLGEITGEIEVDKDILGAIFSKFCIGK